MKQILFTVLLLLIVCRAYPQQKQQIAHGDDFFNAVIQLKAFKAAEKTADSLKIVYRLPYAVSIDIVNAPLSKPDSLNNWATAFINIGVSTYGNQIAYTVKYDKKLNKIIAVKAEKITF